MGCSNEWSVLHRLGCVIVYGTIELCLFKCSVRQDMLCEFCCYLDYSSNMAVYSGWIILRGYVFMLLYLYMCAHVVVASVRSTERVMSIRLPLRGVH